MRRFLLTGLYVAACAIAADKDFNGRWDITVPENDRRRAWWLEITGAETGKPTGSFISAYGGDLNRIDEAKIENGELHVVIRSKNPSRRGSTHLRARLVNGRLEGTRELADGEQGPVLKFTGVRAPKFKQVDASKLKPGAAVELFNGRDLSGWHPSRPVKTVDWSVKDGITTNSPGAVDLVSDQKFWNFKLHAEYRVGPKSNSGIGLRGRYEAQILEDFGRPPDTHSHGALYSRIAPTENASKPAGEWQAVDITLVENRVTIVLNGKTVIDNKEIDGLTAMAIDPNEAEPGPIAIQGDHGKVEFRKLTITPLN